MPEARISNSQASLPSAMVRLSPSKSQEPRKPYFSAREPIRAMASRAVFGALQGEDFELLDRQDGARVRAERLHFHLLGERAFADRQTVFVHEGVTDVEITVGFRGLGDFADPREFGGFVVGDVPENGRHLAVGMLAAGDEAHPRVVERAVRGMGSDDGTVGGGFRSDDHVGAGRSRSGEKHGAKYAGNNGALCSHGSLPPCDGSDVRILRFTRRKAGGALLRRERKRAPPAF